MLKFPLACLALVSAFRLACAADFSLVDTDGNLHTPQAHHGKWLLVNFWATWCAPCLKEIPDLDAASRAHPNLVVLGVAVDGADRAALTEFVRKLQVTYPIIASNPAAVKQFAPNGYPTSILFDEHGQQVLRHEGVITQQQIEQVIGAGKP